MRNVLSKKVKYMKINKILHYAAIILVVSVNIGCDQISKAVVRENLEDHEDIQVLGEHVVLTKVENSGAFLSLGDSLSPLAKSLLLTAIPSVTLLMMFFWLFAHNPGKWAIFGLCCMVGGGIGNIFDRIVYGSVTDFMFIQFGFFRTGIFNAADVSITFGMCLVVAQQVFKSRKNCV